MTTHEVIGCKRSNKITVADKQKINQMVKQTAKDMQKAVNAIKGVKAKEGATVGDALKALYDTFFDKPGDLSFEEWVAQHLKDKAEQRD